MKIWPIFLIAGAVLLSGCAGTPENPWNELTTETDPAARSLDCGSFPYPDQVAPDGVVYSEAGVRALEAYRVCSEANATLADTHADQVGALKQSRASLVEAGQAQHAVAELRAEILQEERRHHAWSNVGKWVLIIILGAAL